MIPMPSIRFWLENFKKHQTTAISTIYLLQEFRSEKQMTLSIQTISHETVGVKGDWEFLPEKQMTLYNTYFLHQLIVGVLQL